MLIKYLFRIILFCLCIFASHVVNAQFTSAMIGVNGLTCSACTRTVEMSIRKLNFIKDVEMNLEHTEGKLTFQENSDVDILKVAQAVTDAGFSVRFLHANYRFNDLSVNNGFCFGAGKFNLQFINIEEKKLVNDTQLKFLGNDFQIKKEANKIKSLLVNKCSDQSVQTYFVTL